MDIIDEQLKRLTSYGSWEIIAKDNKTTYMASDGPHGLRFVTSEENGYQTDEPSFAYPTLSFLANTWDLNLIKQIGNAIAEDCIKHNVSMILGPGVNIKRTPLCGRNFEYFSEDPYLSGMMGQAYINGVQEKKVGACLKHFAVNNREYDRFYQSSEVDERTLKEIYLKPFEIALKAAPYAVMCAYNPVNGILSSENEYLLKQVLRNEFSYEGLVISDWGSVRDRAKSLKAGIDVAFPYNDAFYNQLKKGLECNYITKQEVNESLLHIDQFIEKIKKVENNIVINHQELCEKAVEDGIVLLKNEAILPLNNNPQKILLVGEFLNNPIISGGGSSKVTPNNKVEDLMSCLKKDGLKSDMEYVLGYMIRYGLPTPFGYKIALEKASNSDMVIVGVGNTMLEEKEETDRTSIKLNPVFIDLIKKLATYNKKVIVVLYCGSAIDVSDFVDDVQAIILAGYAGQGVNVGLSKVLLGLTSPSGRLAESWAMKLEDTYTNNQVGNSFIEHYSDHVFVGYRYYTSNNIKTRYPFGYGLSYINVRYNSLKIVNENDNYHVFVEVENLSNIQGKEVIQLYINDVVSSVSRPIRELKKFTKILLKANEKKTVEFIITKDDLKYYHPSLHRWYLEDGDYNVLICKDAENVVLSEKITICEDYYSQYSKY